MILHQAFRVAPLDGREDPGACSPAEEEYLARCGHPAGSRLARLLAKQLVLEFLGRQEDPRLIEILPATLERGGPPIMRLPESWLPAGIHAHISLSHSRMRAAALLVVEKL